PLRIDDFLRAAAVFVRAAGQDHIGVGAVGAASEDMELVRASAALGPVLAEGEADVHGTAVAEADRLLRHPLGNARIGGIGGGLTTCGLLHRDPCRARLLVLGADLQDRASAEE